MFYCFEWFLGVNVLVSRSLSMGSAIEGPPKSKDFKLTWTFKRR